MTTKSISNGQGISIKISWLVIAAILLVTNLITIFLWKPWDSTSAVTRKVSVSGESKIKAVPDEYTISPYFEFTNADRTKATEELTKLGTSITAKLKELGVKDEQIKSSTSGYERYSYAATDTLANTLQLQYTLTVSDKDMAQKIQDYLLALKPKGQISPIAQFSETKRKELEEQARDKALADAKERATKTANQLGAKIGKVLTIADAVGYGGGPIAISGMASTKEAKLDTTVSSLPIQVGQDEFNYSVSVEYELK